MGRHTEEGEKCEVTGTSSWIDHGAYCIQYAVVCGQCGDVHFVQGQAEIPPIPCMTIFFSFLSFWSRTPLMLPYRLPCPLDSPEGKSCRHVHVASESISLVQIRYHLLLRGPDLAQRRLQLPNAMMNFATRFELKLCPFQHTRSLTRTSGGQVP